MKIVRTNVKVEDLDHSFFEELWKITGVPLRDLIVKHFKDHSRFTDSKLKYGYTFEITPDLILYESTRDGPFHPYYNEVTYINLLLKYNLVKIEM